MEHTKLQKFIIYGWLLLDVIGISVLIPAFPELKAFYGINDFQVTLWLTIYSLFAFVAAPLVWQLSDRYGRKPSLIWCVAGTALSYAVLLITRSYRVFILSRIINGITWWNVSILQAVLTDISATKEEKTKNFGLMWAVFWLWFIIWPVIWALLLKFGWINGIFWWGTVFGVIELLLLIFAFRNTNTLEPIKVISFNSLWVIYKYFSKEHLRPFLLSLGLLWVWWFMINATQSLYMNHLFGTSGEHYWYYLAWLGIIMWINMAVLVPKFWTKKFSNQYLIIGAHIALIVWYLIVWLLVNELAFLGFFYVTMLLWNIYNPLYNVEIMSHAKPDEIGEISWMLWWLQSFFMFLWPLIGGIMLSQHINIFSSSSALCLVSLIIMLLYRRKRQ
jgi:MFS transporter, DHA1 family, tetracycline resistance protein